MMERGKIGGERQALTTEISSALRESLQIVRNPTGGRGDDVGVKKNQEEWPRGGRGKGYRSILPSNSENRQSVETKTWSRGRVLCKGGQRPLKENRNCGNA